MDSSGNPFNITKAVHFSDQEINDYWVDIPDSGGFIEMAKPNSPMPMLVLGGKGSGKTHLMRFFSYPVQKIRNSSDILLGIGKEGYLGIYLLCGGLNSERFRGKGQTEETWKGLFSYYIELWLGQILITILNDIYSKYPDLQHQENQLCSDILSLFDVKYNPEVYASFAQLSKLMRDLHHELDRQVNNCVITCSLDLQIKLTSAVSHMFCALFWQFDFLSAGCQIYVAFARRGSLSIMA